eukprot:78429-Pyramimonas_sp.AAC.1
MGRYIFGRTQETSQQDGGAKCILGQPIEVPTPTYESSSTSNWAEDRGQWNFTRLKATYR